MVQGNATPRDKASRQPGGSINALKPQGRRLQAPAGLKYSLAVLAFLSCCLLLLPSCVFLYHPVDQNNMLPSGQQPDKILYERSVNEIKHNRYDVGRLTLQTLLNTYPDSEYLAKAKLAIANSYYQQGGISGLTESESEYKDFITFFPTAPEAPMAQFRVGMAHFRLMGKPDRDLTETRMAVAEFKEFLLKYPSSPLTPRVKARLREAQEVLAEGEFGIAEFYYEKHANPAAKSRLKEIVNRYPNFSMADKACWYLAKTYQRLKKPKAAVPYYNRILTDYPLSPLEPEAKQELTEMHQPIPEPTLATLARARADAAHNIQPSMFQRIMGVFSSSPNLHATRRGPVILGPMNGGVEMAGNSGRESPSNNTVAAEQVNESDLKNGKSEDSKQAQKKESKSRTEASAHPQKGKGPLHLLRKVVKPF